MEALREITGGLFPAHTYLVDGTSLVAYIKVGESEPFYFKSPIKGFDKRGRKFERVKNTFKAPVVAPVANTKQVAGSKGNVYTLDLDAGTCTCSGYSFRGTCKHVKELELA
jgi:hypothetical protein